jgi:hypothetical protein
MPQVNKPNKNIIVVAKNVLRCASVAAKSSFLFMSNHSALSAAVITYGKSLSARVFSVTATSSQQQTKSLDLHDIHG